MSIDLQELQGSEPARIALDEFCATQDEFTEFFGDVFDQFQALSLELFARHKCLETGTEQKAESEKSLAGAREEFQRSIEELRQLHGQFQADRQEARGSWAAAFQLYQDETRAGYQRLLDDRADLREMRAGFRQMAGEVSEIKEELKRMCNLLKTFSTQ